MNIVLLQAASGNVDGPIVRVPPGSYKVERSGKHERCTLFIDDTNVGALNGVMVLGDHSSLRLLVEKAVDLTIKLHRS